MRLKLTLLAAPIIALAFVAAAFARTDQGTGTTSVSATAAVKCGTTRTIGFAGALTGPAASIGQQQFHWAQYYVKAWNKTHPKAKISILAGDTMLDAAEAPKVAQSLAAKSKVLGVVGPVGSQEVVASTKAYKSGGLAFVSGSATRTSLTDGHTAGNRRGYFFRVVPNDGVQGPTVANYITKKLKVKNVFIIDDQETYSQGLADGVEAILKGRGVTVTRDSYAQKTTDFSSLITKIGSSVQIVYIPWQLASDAQTFGQQLKAAGKSAKLFGSDGLYDPSTFKIPGSYDSFFPVDPKSAIVKAFAKAHKGDAEFFGAPTYVAAQVIVGAVTKACADGTATRAEVRKDLAATKLKTSVLGLPVAFSTGGDLKGGAFGIYQIQGDGSYKPVG
jgi:ABC-type branched-subunit amino acid transport system substrate-binding protein